MASVKERIQKAYELCEQGDLDKAYAITNEILTADPHNHLALYVCALALMKAERRGIAYHLFKSHQDYQERPEVWTNIGYCLQGEEHFAECEQAYLRAHKMLGGEEAAWKSRKKAEELEAQGRHAEAKDYREHVRHVATSFNNLSMIATELARPKDAVSYAEKALRLDPGYENPKWNASLSLLRMKQWRMGWEWYDAALGYTMFRRAHAYGEPHEQWWEGKGGTVIVYEEQGIGDQIMFASIIPDAIEAADKVVLDVDPRLVKLFRRSFPKAAYVTTTRRSNTLAIPEEIGKITHRLAIGSLGRLFRNDTKDFPGKPFLVADPERRIQWKALLDTLPGRKIGVMWQGGTRRTGEQKRSMTLETLLPILKLPDVTWVSLNHRPDAETEIDAFEQQHGIKIHHWKRGVDTDDYDDTAALVSELDCIVSVTTAVIHLAGALGKEAHVFVPLKPTWRYADEGSTLEWYGETVRLYRQTEKGSWNLPVLNVRKVLTAPQRQAA